MGREAIITHHQLTQQLHPSTRRRRRRRSSSLIGSTISLATSQPLTVLSVAVLSLIDRRLPEESIE